MDNIDVRKWMEGLSKFDEDNRVIIMAIMSVLRVPPSYLDIGCGTGIMVKTARQLGVDAVGIDQLPHIEDYLVGHDLSQNIDLGKKFDLITTIEVAEHIEERFSENFINTIDRHMNQNSVLVFTAAMPGQPGNGHVNCKPALYWRAKIDARGISYNEMLTYRIGLALKNANHPHHHIEANLQVFSR